MEIPESTYYYKPKDDLSKKKRDADIADAIEAISLRFPLIWLQEGYSGSQAKGYGGKP